VSTSIDRAAARYAAGVAAGTDGHPVVAARQLRSALRHLDGRRSADPMERPVAELCGRILISLAGVEAERGRASLGFRLLDEAESLIPAQLRGLLRGQRGVLLQRTGRDELAMREYDAAIALLGAQPDLVDLVKALSNRGSVHLRAGRIRLSRADLHRSAEIARRNGLTMLAAIVTHNLGDLELLSGDLPSALSTFAGVADVYQDLAPGLLPDLATDRARALLAAGLFGEADRELEAAVAQTRARRLSYAQGRALLARAEAALLAGRPAAARTWAAEARARLLRRHNVRHAALAELLALRAGFAATAAPATVADRGLALADKLNGLGLGEDSLVAGMLTVRALIACRRVAEAERELARQRRPRGSDRLDTRLLRRLTHAELATAAGRPAQAARHLRAGMATLQRYRSQLGCLDLQTGAAVHGRDLAAAGLSAAVASGSAAKVYRWSELARAQALLLPPVRPPEDARAAAALEELRQARGALREAELCGAPTGALRRRSEALQRVIREHAWSAAGPGTATTPAPMQAVMAELAEAAMVVYLRDGAVLWALVMVDGSARLVRLGSLADAEEALLRLRADLDAQAGRVLRSRLAGAVAEVTRRDAAALAAAVLDPVLGLIGDRDLVVVPTGALMTVPWAVLSGCAQRPVTVAPSATTWRVARGRRDARMGGPALARTLLVAGPGNERGEAEVRAIAAISAHATVLTGSAATPAATLARLGDVRIAHLAAHGHHAADNPLFSALDLAGGPLMGYDLQRADGTPGVVVLSSCDLGLTSVRPGDETLGMITVLLSTGSSTVVASVSRVADDTAMTIMINYHLATSRGLPPAVALAAATKPAHLASFVCFGAG
jgi:CHAT domain-containing protein